jgi:hypothetical protein
MATIFVKNFANPYGDDVSNKEINDIGYNVHTFCFGCIPISCTKVINVFVFSIFIESLFQKYYLGKQIASSIAQSNA